MNIFRSTILSICTIATLPYAQDLPQPAVISGWGWLTMGRVESSKSQGEKSSSVAQDQTYDSYDLDFKKQWLVNFEAGLKATRTVGKHSKARLHFMTSLQYPILRNSTATQKNAEPLLRKFSITLLDATLQSTFNLIPGIDTLESEFGYFPVKYNPQSTNLGEYLFRSGTYPAYVISGFELADKVKLTGLHLSYRFRMPNLSTLRQDVYFTNDMDIYPVHDFSLSYLAGFTTPYRLFDFSLGINFAHLITLDETAVTPGKDELSLATNPSRVAFIDSATHDTTLLTFRGTKVMGRFILDPKAWFRSTIFGAQDLKIYGEIAVLGVKNYPGWYNNIFERMPIMLGINLPTFKIIDVLSIEVEYYEMPYWNSTEFIWKQSTPYPYTGSSAIVDYYSARQRKSNDDWRWSIYASKKINNVIRLSLQFASDHTLRTPYMPTGLTKYTEICTTSKDWYWMARVMYLF